MNTDVEELLREGMERFTADLRAPAGLTRLAERRRRRRLAFGSLAGVAAGLAAGAVALAVVVVPDAGHAGIDTTAYVVNRVGSALSAAEPGDIAQMTITTSGAPQPYGTTGTTTAEEWSYGDQWRAVVYSSPGHVVYDEGGSSKSVYTLVNYATRTWARQPRLGSPAPLAAVKTGSGGCEPLGLAAFPVLFRIGLPAIASYASSLPATVASALRAAVSCGALTVAGHQRVDGIDAIKLTSRPASPISETIWVSPGTYLPVRAVVGSPFAGQSGPTQTVDISWLPPTAQNLAKLTVPVPAGFRRVPLVGALLPLQKLPAAQLPRPGKGFGVPPEKFATVYLDPPTPTLRPKQP